MLDETFKEWERKMRQQGRREAEREAQKLLQQGRREAEREAQKLLQQGQRETQKLLRQEHREEQKMLLGMLRDRFGPVPQAVRQRVRDLSSPELRTMARRLITASSLQETGLLEGTVEVGRGRKTRR